MRRESKRAPADRWLFDQLPQGAMMLDRERQVLAVNPRASNQLGLSEECARGRRCREVTRCQADDELCPFDQVVKHGETRRTVLGVTAKERPACQHLAPLRDHGGELVAVLELLHEPPRESREALLELSADDDPAEREQLLNALAGQRWRRGEAARVLGISRTTLWRRLKALDLD